MGLVGVGYKKANFGKIEAVLWHCGCCPIPLFPENIMDADPGGCTIFPFHCDISVV